MVKEHPKLKEKTDANAKPIERPALCLKAGEGRYFLIQRLSHIRKRNRDKEIRNRMKEMNRVMLYAA